MTFKLKIEGGDEWYFHGLEGQIKDEHGNTWAVGAADTDDEIAQLRKLAAADDLLDGCKRTLEILDAWGPERRGDTLERLHARLSAAVSKAERSES